MPDVEDNGAGLLAGAAAALETAEQYERSALATIRQRLMPDGKPDAAMLEAHQRAAHGFAWIASTVAALRALHHWAAALEDRQAFGTPEALCLRIAFGEYLAQLASAIPMGPNEWLRPADLELEEAASLLAQESHVSWFLANGSTAESRAALAQILAEGDGITDRFADEDLNTIRDQYRRFTDERILPHAHQWHLDNALIPDGTVSAMADLGTFGVSIPEEYGGLGLGKIVMCIVSEELSRGWIGTGSLGTRSEIAGELISLAGTDAQKKHWLPGIARGEILPTAVFTEPDVGSDLGSLKTRARRTEQGWQVNGAKTWITHAARSDLMTLLVRTDDTASGYNGLSMLLVPKARGTDEVPFPDQGLTGSEIHVLGYRGMREYELSFDGLTAPEEALLGGQEGQGFKQLMRTFESARIQTAARAVGVARRAFDLGLSYAGERTQFGKQLIRFPRIADKLVMMAVETVAARELTYAAAREKDKGRRCDIEAGMAKLFAARTAWTNADAALQIHGGNGYALEYEISRVLCDARILSIFEGTAEIQAQVIVRGRLAERN